MKLSREHPPVYDRIVATLGEPHPDTVYTYGDTIYNPSGADLDPGVRFHETVHQRQQIAVGGPDAWWDRYQELEAYREQFRLYAQVLPRPRRREIQRVLARHLSSRQYGHVMTFEQAMRGIAA